MDKGDYTFSKLNVIARLGSKPAYSNVEVYPVGHSVPRIPPSYVGCTKKIFLFYILYFNRQIKQSKNIIANKYLHVCIHSTLPTHTGYKTRSSL